MFANLAGVDGRVPSSAEILASFREEWPDKAVLRHSTVMEFRGVRVSGLGICSFDASSENVAMALLTTTGVKLLEVESKRGKARGEFRIEGVNDRARAASELAGDVAFAFIQPGGPPANATVQGNQLRFVWIGADGGRTELVFGRQNIVASPVRLLEKVSFAEDGVRRRSAFYYDYKPLPDGKSIPGRIRLENSAAGYNVTLEALK